MNNQETILQMLQSIDRPGMDKVIEYVRNGRYFTVPCHSHHRGRGGMAQHSLEVYRHMSEANKGQYPEDSIIIAALFHDLGKAAYRSEGFTGMHDERSLQILDRCGLELTEDERMAITNHHREFRKLFCPLYLMTVAADCTSTGAWKAAHSR